MILYDFSWSRFQHDKLYIFLYFGWLFTIQFKNYMIYKLFAL